MIIGTIFKKVIKRAIKGNGGSKLCWRLMLVFLVTVVLYGIVRSVNPELADTLFQAISTLLLLGA